MKNRHFLYTCLILHLMRSLANRWFLSLMPHCMTTSSHTDESNGGLSDQLRICWFSYAKKTIKLWSSTTSVRLSTATTRHLHRVSAIFYTDFPRLPWPKITQIHNLSTLNRRQSQTVSDRKSTACWKLSVVRSCWHPMHSESLVLH